MKSYIVILTLLASSFVFAQSSPKSGTLKAPDTKNSSSTTPKKRKGVAITPSVGFAPDFLRKEVKPGETLTEKIVVQNGANAEIEAELVVFDLVTDEYGRVILDEKSKNKKSKGKNKLTKQTLPSIVPHITIPEKVFKLKAKEKKVITYSIKIPENASGSYYFRYSVRPLSKYTAQLKKNLNGALGFLMNINALGVVMVKDTQSQKADISFKGNYLKPAKRLLLESEIKNTGNGYLRNLTASAVIIKDSQVVGKVDLSQAEKLQALYPNTRKKFLGALEVELTKGEYKVVITYQDEKKWLVQTSTHNLSVK